MIKKILQLAEIALPPEVEPIRRRYIHATNRFYLLSFLFILTNIGVALYTKNAEFQIVFSRILLGLGLMSFYPLFLRFKLYNFSRFYIVSIPIVVTLYLPLLTGNLGEEFFIKSVFQPLAFLVFIFWCLHPKVDRLYFSIAVSLPLPFTFLTIFLWKIQNPASAPFPFEQIPLNLFFTPCLFYLATVYGLTQIVLSREKGIENNEHSNETLEETLKGQHRIEEELKSIIETSEKNLLYFKNMRRYDLQLPLQNLKTLHQMILNEKESDQIKLSDLILSKLENSIQQLEKEINK